MFVPRSAFGRFSKTAVAAVNSIQLARSLLALVGSLITLCVVGAAQPLNINVTEFPITLPAPTPPWAQLWGLTLGPDGALWFTESGKNDIGRITSSGTVTFYSLPPDVGGLTGCQPASTICAPWSITTGPDGALWFTGALEIGNLTTGGTARLFPLVGNPVGITSGPDGALWYTRLSPPGISGTGFVGRITTSGVMTEYAVKSGIPESIITGPDGALWFVISGYGFGRITTYGSLTEYSVPSLGHVGLADYGSPFAVGPDGAFWFGSGQGQIGHMTTAGVYTEFHAGTAQVSGIAEGPDGAMWFTVFGSELGRIRTSGLVTFYNTPSWTTGPIVLGADGALWYGEMSNSIIARVQIPSRTGVLSHIAAGAGWTTVATLVNTSTAAVPLTVAFHNDDGSALSLPVTITNQGATQTTTSASVSATINPNATLLISIGDVSAPLAWGWSDVDGTGPLGGYAIFRYTPQTGSPSEGTVPLQTQFPSSFTLPYDNTAGFSMGVALANLSTSTANITATMWDVNGNQLGTENFTVAGSGHTAFTLPQQWALTAGQQGIIQFQSNATGGIAGLGLRFSPFGTFTSVSTILP